MNEPLSPEQRERQNEALIVEIARNQGMDGLHNWIMNHPDPDVDGSQVRIALRLLEEGRPASYVEDLVHFAVESRSQGMRQRVRRWELESVIQAADEPRRKDLLSRIRAYFKGDNLDWATSAARCLPSVGFCYPEASDELLNLISRLDRGSEQRSHVVSVSAYLGVLKGESLASHIEDLIKAVAGYNRSLVFLIANSGDGDSFRYLESHFDHDSHTVLLAMLQMCLRVKEVRRKTLHRFLKADRGVRWGLDHYAIWVFDSQELVNQYIDQTFAALVNNGSVLPEITLLKSCVREGQLEGMERTGESLSPRRIEALKASILEVSGHRGLINDHATYRKESSISLASRLGMPSLRSWLPLAMQGEMNRGLMQRMAQDCCLFGVRDFVLNLGNELKLHPIDLPGLEGTHEDDPSSASDVVIENPMWLVSDEAGVVGGEATLRVLLESDGRHGTDQALMSYVDGLAFAAVNVGSTDLLTRTMLDESEPPWRRSAAAHAVRKADLYEPVPQTDWKLIERFVSDLSQETFARLELLIALAGHDSAATARIISCLPEEDSKSSQSILARIIAMFDVEGALEHLGRYLAPVKYPYRSDFEKSYAAICIARLYEAGKVSGQEASRFLQNGLRHELSQFCRSCAVIRDEDEKLFHTVWAGTLEQNRDWRANPDLWRSIGRFRPMRLVSSETVDHVLMTSDASKKGYLDAILEQRSSFHGTDANLWSLLYRLSSEGSRAVGWYSAFVSSVVCPSLSREFIQSESLSGFDLRYAMECALWLEDTAWQIGFAKAKLSQWRIVADYADELNAERERIRLAVLYFKRIQSTDDRLRDWRYAQALLKLPSERLLLDLREWKVNDIQDGYLSNWLRRNIEHALKKSREDLFKKSRLPGEEAIPRWF